jgi:cholesterol transport system auxiliary component
VRRLAIVGLVALLCAGCFGPGARSKVEAPDTYRLTAPAIEPIGTAAVRPEALAVSRPRAAPALDTAGIAIARPGQSFDYYSGVRWAESAPAMIQQLIVQSLTTSGVYTTVVTSPSRVPVNQVLDVELRRFEAVADSESAAPRVVVELQLTLVDAKQGTRLGSALATAEATAGANRRGAVIAAFEEATSAALRDCVTSVRSVAEAAPAVGVAAPAPTGTPQ